MSIHSKQPGKLKWFFLIVTINAYSCKKFIEIDPPVTSIASSTVFNTNTNAEAAMTGVYDNLIDNDRGLVSGKNSIGYSMGLSADELKNYATSPVTYSLFYKNALSSATNSASNTYFWQEFWKQVYACNAVLEGVNSSSAISAPVKQQLIGEAEFMRAFLHFYAMNLYGEVPIVTTTNYLTNTAIARSPETKVYEQIIADLKDAQNKLSDNFVDAAGQSTTERIRPNKGAATALLARVYLYKGDWNNAAIEATLLINNTAAYSLYTDLNQVFLLNNQEAIWQMQPVDAETKNTWDGRYFVLTSPPGNGRNIPVTLSTMLINAFEINDKRRVNWVGTYTNPSTSITYYYPNKYKAYLQNTPQTEYFMVLRLAEQYLIRAEAEAHGGTGDLAAAVTDLNIIRNRAGLPDYSGLINQASVLTAIQHERQVELFTEWGHRWFDLKRTNTLNAVMGNPGNVCATKGGTWNSDHALLPLPFSELVANHNLTQNPGY